MALINIIMHWVTTFLLSDTASTPLHENIYVYVCHICTYILYVRRNANAVSTHILL